MAKINIVENLFLCGRLSFTVYKNNAPVRKFAESNLIVNTARMQMARLVAGDVDDRSISSIAVGSSGNMPTVNDTEITEPFEKLVDSFEFPETGQVKINWKLEMHEANGMTIREFGLLAADGALFARCICADEPIQKDSDISLEGEWLLTFATGG